VVGYLVAVVLILLAIALEMAVAPFYNHVEIAGGVLVFLAILFIGIHWGAGPSLLATLLGTMLLYCLVYPPLFGLTLKDLLDMVQASLVLFGGVLVTQSAQHREIQRRAAERRAAEAEQTQRRLQTVLETLLALVEALVHASAGEISPEKAESLEEDMVARRLAEVTCYALDCQQVRFFSVEPATGERVLLAEVSGPPEPAEGQGPTPARRELLSAWLDPEQLTRLYRGEMVLVDPPQLLATTGSLPCGELRALVVPVQRDGTLLGLLTLAAPWTQVQMSAHLRDLVRAITKLGALVIEREHLLHERAQAQAEALTHQEAKRQMEMFLGIASHELKTPLTSLLLGLEGAQRHLARVPIPAEGAEGNALRTLQDDLLLAFQQGRRLERLVKELLDSSRIEAGRLELYLARTDLIALVREAVEEQRRLTPERILHLQAFPEQEVLVVVDKERVKQVLSNYLSNALKYSPEDRPVEVGLQVEGQQARVWVRDEGPGISPALLARVWERFYRAPGIEVLSGSGVGLGLGLYLSRTLIEQQHGQVGVESTPGHGTRFWFTLPLSSEDAQASQRPLESSC
jgi:signal transduction histidine kinase